MVIKGSHQYWRDWVYTEQRGQSTLCKLFICFSLELFTGWWRTGSPEYWTIWGLITYRCELGRDGGWRATPVPRSTNLMIFNSVGFGSNYIGVKCCPLLLSLTSFDDRAACNCWSFLWSHFHLPAEDTLRHQTSHHPLSPTLYTIRLPLPSSLRPVYPSERYYQH